MSLDRAGITERIGEILEAHTTPSFTVVAGEPLALAPDGSPFACFWYLGDTDPPEGRMTLSNVMVMERFQITCFWHRVLELGSFESLEAEIWQANRTLKAALRGDSTLHGEDNLLANGGFETDATGWTTSGTNTIVRSTEQAKSGAASLKATYQNSAGLARNAVTLAAEEHVFSVWVYIPAEYDGDSIILTDNGDFASATGTQVDSADMSIRDEWQRLIADITPVAGDLVGALHVRNSGTAPTAGRYIYIDNAKVEVGSAATTYIEPGEEATDIDITDSQVDYGVFPLQGESAVMYRTLEFELLVKSLEEEAIAP